MSSTPVSKLKFDKFTEKKVMLYAYRKKKLKFEKDIMNIENETKVKILK